jgi:hypothetical protein
MVLPYRRVSFARAVEALRRGIWRRSSSNFPASRMGKAGASKPAIPSRLMGDYMVRDKIYPLFVNRRDDLFGLTMRRFVL